MEGVTEDDADTYLDAAVGLARFEMGLDCMDVGAMTQPLSTTPEIMTITGCGTP